VWIELNSCRVKSTPSSCGPGLGKGGWDMGGGEEVEKVEGEV